MGKLVKILLLVMALAMVVVSFYPAQAADANWRSREGVASGVILEIVSGDLNRTFTGTYLLKTDDGKTLAFRINNKTAFQDNNYYGYKKGDKVLVTYDTQTVNELANTYDATSIQVPVTSKTVDYTQRVATWYGKVNQHVNIKTGKWETDPDGISGANLDLLTYCKKWYPKSTSYKEYKKEIITFYDRGNTQVAWPKDAYTIENLSYQCVQGAVALEKLPDLYLEKLELIDTNNPKVGDTLHFFAKIINKGNVESGSYVVDKNGVYGNYNSLKPDQSNVTYGLGYTVNEKYATYSYAGYYTYHDAGYYTYTLTLDPKNQINESDEYNNTKTVTVYVGSKDTSINSCTTDYNPVCGTDGKTYSNSCVASQSKVKVDYVGECKKKDTSGLPDLIINTVGLNNINVNDNEDVTIFVDVKNIGQGDKSKGGFGVSGQLNGKHIGFEFIKDNNERAQVLPAGKTKRLEQIYTRSEWNNNIKYLAQKGYLKDGANKITLTVDDICSACISPSQINSYVEESNENNNSYTANLYYNSLTGIVSLYKQDDQSKNNLTCTTDYTPVCGTDGKTYSNSCNASLKGAKVDYYGECKKAQTEKPLEPVIVNPEIGVAQPVASEITEPTVKPIYQPKTTTQAKPVLESIKGRIVLQVEKNGEAYYASPKTNKVYYLKDGNSAYQTMKETGAGINEADFINLMSSNTKGQELRKRFAGQIVLRVKAKGEAYYINPSNLSVTYMPDGNAAYQIMREQGLGITDENLAKVIDVNN